MHRIGGGGKWQVVNGEIGGSLRIRTFASPKCAASSMIGNACAFAAPGLADGAAVVGIFIVAGATAIALVNPRLTRYVESEAFRAELEKQTA